MNVVLVLYVAVADVFRGLKVVKSCSLAAHPIHFFRHFCCGVFHLLCLCL